MQVWGSDEDYKYMGGIVRNVYACLQKYWVLNELKERRFSTQLIRMGETSRTAHAHSGVSRSRAFTQLSYNMATAFDGLATPPRRNKGVEDRKKDQRPICAHATGSFPRSESSLQEGCR
jgi:hypothetical protein